MSVTTKCNSFPDSSYRTNLSTIYVTFQVVPEGVESQRILSDLPEFVVSELIWYCSFHNILDIDIQIHFQLIEKHSIDAWLDFRTK